MKQIVVLGHGGYAEGVRQNIEMIAGVPAHMHFLDLTKEDDLASFEVKVKEVLAGFPEDEVLFACDLLGASPFRVAALLSAGQPEKYSTVAGLNAMAFLELSMTTGEDMSLDAFADLAVETAKSAVAKFSV